MSTVIGDPNIITFSIKPYPPRLAISIRQEYINLDPKENPTNVIGLTPKFPDIMVSAKILPAFQARSKETFQGLSNK